MEFNKLKRLLRFGNKYLHVTLKDRSVKMGQFISYKAEKDNPELVEQINLFDGGELMKLRRLKLFLRFFILTAFI